MSQTKPDGSQHVEVSKTDQETSRMDKECARMRRRAGNISASTGKKDAPNEAQGVSCPESTTSAEIQILQQHILVFHN